ncbi:EAL domain-containing protein [Desertibacillus haloalkaliphilus]|uniref:EAL domain-containing protein n=1 Tax=Desertibacillus haloalkaliphilus TaxID=1328930 RepID=UPI001C26EA41|nr:EAL-associated domain-containing protein [Desertibacillus haloalkaliphilus]MBU8907446.1 EAL domain-containing protein [Desertibacillus haloalkaliphilus]
MDALDILMNKDQVIPYFEPVVSADKQTVIGYEVLSRIETESGVKSLGGFFQDPSIPDEYRLEIDDHVQTLALNYYIEKKTDQLLFLNYNVNLLMNDQGEEFIAKLLAYQEQGLRLDRVVLQIAEGLYIGDISRLKHLLTYIQSLGMKVALTDGGSGGRNLERIAFLKPNIVKVNFSFLDGDNALPQLYRDALHSLSMLTQKIGALLLFDGINSFLDLNYAWRNGGRYYQGNYVAKPKREFVPHDLCKENLKEQFHHFINYERKKIEAQLSITDQLSKSIKSTLKKVTVTDDYDDVVKRVAYELTDISFRVYICDHDGFQQSSNAVRNEEGGWELHPEDRFKNWSWRPYFLENIVRMNYEQKGILSDLYTDIERDEIIRTYAIPIDDQLYLFIDIPYAYLFEKDGLL